MIDIDKRFKTCNKCGEIKNVVTEKDIKPEELTQVSKCDRCANPYTDFRYTVYPDDAMTTRRYNSNGNIFPFTITGCILEGETNG